MSHIDPALDFRVHGRPQQRGSKRAVMIAGKARMLDANKDSRAWMDAVATAAAEAWGGKPLLLGPVGLSVRFDFKRPKGHYGSRKGQPYLRDNAPSYHTTTPDADKLMRSIGDALTGVVYGDDKQICNLLLVEKRYTESSEGAYIRVFDLS